MMKYHHCSLKGHHSPTTVPIALKMITANHLLDKPLGRSSAETHRMSLRGKEQTSKGEYQRLPVNPADHVACVDRRRSMLYLRHYIINDSAAIYSNTAYTTISYHYQYQEIYLGLRPRSSHKCITVLYCFATKLLL